MSFSLINPSSVHETGAYAHAARLGNLLFVAGQVPRDAGGELVGRGDPGAQAEQVLANLKAVVEAAGSGLDLIGKITVLTTSHSHLAAIFAVIRRVFEPVGHYPANIVGVVQSLADPNWLVEIDAVAVVRE